MTLHTKVKLILVFMIGVFSTVLITACNMSRNQKNESTQMAEVLPTDERTEVIYFAGGCFWGTEHFFKQVKGVTATEVGFANGQTDKPTYKDVVTKDTGYAETVKVSYDPGKVSLDRLLDLYFLTIDPTSVNRQGNDVGDQYRTGIYYTSKEQLPLIKERIKKEAAKYAEPIAVEVSPIQKYFKAEDYHQDYLENNPGGYCHINPKLFELARKAN